MRFVLSTLSLLPLRALYALMNGVLYPLMYYVIRYRRRVVERNIAASFPDKTDAERKQMQKEFYHYFCDLLAEIIYAWRISDKEIRERVTIINQDEVEEAVLKAGGGFVMLGHYGCWEWIADYARRFHSPEVLNHIIYRRLKSKSADEAMRELRRKRGGEPLEMHSMVRQLVRNRQDGHAHIYAMLSDQKPSRNDLDCCVPFLNQLTPFITGTDHLARRTGFPVYYIDIESPKRGYYVIKGVLITDNPSATPEGYITREYARLLEENILRQPHLWLWSHNRFKYSKPL